ncbi:MAG: PhzF family phenazine biosynthesis protein [Gammaproteobacteria bacterium]|nr:PhzF family phenazine biosynthesis protein [Gammaproteobacteria bacterium]
MATQYFLLDVFADAPFQGTQIPVVMPDRTLSSSEKLQIASEFQKSETVFLDTANVEAPFSVYNDTRQTIFGAHTILAAAYIAHEMGLSQDQGAYTSFEIVQNKQTIKVFIDKVPDGIGSIQFARTILPSIDRFTPSLSRIAKALNIDEKHMSFSKYRPMVVSVDNPTLIIPFTRAEHVQAAKLNSESWSELLSETYAAEIFLFAPKSHQDIEDFHGRIVNPNVANNVFPPIGNVMPEFVAYLAEQKETADGTHTFSIDRGSELTRKSVLHVEFDKRPGKSIQCRIGGRVVKMGVGTLLFP